MRRCACGCSSGTMEVNDQCRRCREKLRVNGQIGNSRRIFHKDTHEKSIYERLLELGLKLPNVQERSYRVCLKCCRLVGRLEEAMATLKSWKEAEETPSSELLTPTETPVSERKASASHPHPRTPAAPPDPRYSWPTAENFSRQRFTLVTVYYPSKPKGDKIVCNKTTAGIVEALARDNWNWAAKLITSHKELYGPLTESILSIIEEECKRICNPITDFVLFKSSVEDLRAFSLHKMQADFQRVAPFLFSIFLRIAKQSENAACAAAAIALRGREPRMSAFSYYVNGILQNAGTRKAAFQRLSKFCITTSYERAFFKQREMAEANDIFLTEEQDPIPANGGSVPGSVTKSAEEAPGTGTPQVDTPRADTPEVAVRDLDEAMPGLEQIGLSGVQTPSRSPGPGLNQEIPETPQIKEEQNFKQEEEQLPVPDPESSAVCVKTEESSLLQQRQTEHREETQGEDISAEPHFHSVSEECSISPSVSDNSEDWSTPFSCSAAQMETEADGDHYNQVQIRSRSTAAQNSGPSPKYKSAPETRAAVNNGNMSGTAEGAVAKKKQCSVCKRRFKRKDYLKQHIRVHTGEKPYSYSIRKKRFAFHSHLNVHRRIHRRETLQLFNL